MSSDRTATLYSNGGDIHRLFLSLLLLLTLTLHSTHQVLGQDFSPNSSYTAPICSRSNPSDLAVLPMVMLTPVLQECDENSDRNNPICVSVTNATLDQEGDTMQYAVQAWLADPPEALDDAYEGTNVIFEWTLQLSLYQNVTSDMYLYDEWGVYTLQGNSEFGYWSENDPKNYSLGLYQLQFLPTVDSASIGVGFSLWNNRPVDQFFQWYVLFVNQANISQACMIEYDITVSCCSNPQPPVLVEQPYWILLISTCAYFVASYIWVGFITLLSKLSCFQNFWLNTDPIYQPPDVRSSPASPAPSTVAAVTTMTTENNSSPMKEPLLVQPEADGESTMFTIGKTDPEKEKNIAALRSLTMSDRLARANAWYLLIQLAVVTANYIYLIIRFVWLDSSYLDANQSAWWRYQRITLLWNNSSQITLLASAFASYLLQKYQVYASLAAQGGLPFNNVRARTCAGPCTCGCCCKCCKNGWTKVKIFYSLVPESTVTRRICYAVLFLNLPAFCTNILPAWITFFPFLLLAFSFFAFCSFIVYVVFWATQRTADVAWKEVKSQYSQFYKTSRNEWGEQEGYNDDDTITTGGHVKVPEPLNEDSSQGKVFPLNDLSRSSSSISHGLIISKEGEHPMNVPSPMDEQYFLSPNPHQSDMDENERMNGRAPILVSVSFPWYSILLLRLVCTIGAVLFFQTAYNYAYIVWNFVIAQGDWGDYSNNPAGWFWIIWAETIVAEFASRDTQHWLLGMEQSFHQFMMQISLFT